MAKPNAFAANGDDIKQVQPREDKDAEMLDMSKVQCHESNTNTAAIESDK